MIQKNPMKNKQAVIFDLDGVVINSENIFIDVERQFFKEHGKTYTLELQKRTMGSSGMVAAQVMKKALKISWKPEKILKEIFHRAHKRTAEIELMDGYAAFIQRVMNAQYRRGLGTGAGHDWINFIINKFDLHNHFEVLVSSHDVASPKPAPDIFLEVARRLDVAPAQCVVIEDSPNGIAAAKSAGMKCIGLASHHFKNREVYARADIVRHAFADITLDDLSV